MTLDVRGSLKNTKLSKNPYVVFEELLSNAIDSFLIRKHSDVTAPNLEVTFDVEFLPSDLLGDEFDLKVTCSDNGCGLGDAQANAFLTKDTSYKDDLTISGIGKCKGAGRIQYFHHFEDFSLVSTYQQGEKVLKRSLQFSDPQVQIEPEQFDITEGLEAEIGTSITLAKLKPQVYERKFSGENLLNLFSAGSLKSAMLVAFLQRLVSLNEQLGNFKIAFKTSFKKDKVEQNLEAFLEKTDLPEVSDTRKVKVQERDPRSGDKLDTQQELTLSHYRLDAKTYDLPRVRTHNQNKTIAASTMAERKSLGHLS